MNLIDRKYVFAKDVIQLYKTKIAIESLGFSFVTKFLDSKALYFKMTPSFNTTEVKTLANQQQYIFSVAGRYLSYLFITTAFSKHSPEAP